MGSKSKILFLVLIVFAEFAILSILINNHNKKAKGTQIKIVFFFSGYLLSLSLFG